MTDPEGASLGALVSLVLAVLFLVLMVTYLSRRQRVAFPGGERLHRHEELAPLAALAVCFAAAGATGALGLSPALGAFLAGLYIGNTSERRLMIQATAPVEAVLVMVFFLSVGLLIDLGYIWTNLNVILFLLLAVLITNSATNVLVPRVVGEPWKRAFLAGFALAQIGEFSFILTSVGTENGLIDDGAKRLVVSVIALSLVISPLWLDLARRLENLSVAARASFGEVVALLYRSEAEALRAGSGLALRRGSEWLGLLRREGGRLVRSFVQLPARVAPPPDPAAGGEEEPHPPRRLRAAHGDADET